MVQNANEDQQQTEAEDTDEYDQQQEGGFKTIGEASRGISQLRRLMSDKEIQDDGLDNIED